MKILKLGLKVLLGLIVLAALVLALLLNLHEDSGELDDYYVTASPVSANDVRIRFMGNTNILITDGVTSLMTDAWFSRPSLLTLALADIEPDMTEISNGMQMGVIDKLAAIFPVHSHYDHAMDAPEVARQTGALLVGSESTANIGRGWGLSEDQIRVVNSGEPMQFGKFQVRMIESVHFEFPDPELRAAALSDPVIEEPLVPPVSALDYKMGGAYSLVIEHPKGSVLIHGSAGFVPSQLDAYDVDVVFLGVGGIAGQAPEYQAGYWQHVVRAVDPRWVYPVHWDSLTDPLGQEPVMPNLLVAWLMGFDSTASVMYAINNASADDINVGLLPMWQDVVLFGD
ncbi:MAG: MBL fold metallo-hydrolase [Pseudomonadota bacterium]